MFNCGFCGDILLPEGHTCWLASHFQSQESIEPEPASAYLEIGKEEGDVQVPFRVKKVDLSNL